MASTDAKPIPQKNGAYRVTFPILDADGDLVTGASGLDSEISKDGGTFADCTNEATEIATSSGVYYLDLTSTEMNADCVAIIVKTSTSGGKTTVIVLYPEEAGDIRVNVTQFGGSNGTFSSGRPEVNTTLIEGSDATNQIRDAVVDDSTRIDASALNTLSSHDPGEAIMGATDLGTGSGLTALATASAVATVDSVVDAVKLKTDNLPSDPADQSLIINATDAILSAVGALSIPTAGDNAAAVLAEAFEGAETVQDFLRLARAALYGKAAGMATTTATFRDAADTKDRISATVDASGNRTAVTTDAA